MMLQSQLSQLAKALRLAHETGSLDSPHEQKIAQLEQEKKDLLEMIGLSSGNNVQYKESPSPMLLTTKPSGVLEEFFNE
ncbi:hypothetical protein G6F56_009196 [Rhizopus delemar]|nr:hypothetical protein G6F56_009196 [Rhizopus delemar]